MSKSSESVEFLTFKSVARDVEDLGGDYVTFESAPIVTDETTCDSEGFVKVESLGSFLRSLFRL